MWDGSDDRDAGAEMFSNLSVSCCMSPTGDILSTCTSGADCHGHTYQSAAWIPTVNLRTTAQLLHDLQRQLEPLPCPSHKATVQPVITAEDVQHVMLPV